MNHKNSELLEDEDLNNYLFLKINVKKFIMNTYKLHPIFFSKNFIIKVYQGLFSLLKNY